MADRGRIIDKWVFSVDGTPIKVRVRMDVGIGGTKFRVHEPDYEIDLQNTDIDALKKAVAARLQQELALAWTRYYYITFEGQINNDDDTTVGSARSDLSYELIEMATRPDGTVCYRTVGGHNRHTVDGTPEVGFEDGWRDRAIMQSYVPATPENEAALSRLCNSFKALHSQMFKLLSPEQVEQQLQTLATSLPALLSKPQAEETDGKRVKRKRKVLRKRH